MATVKWNLQSGVDHINVVNANDANVLNLWKVKNHGPSAIDVTDGTGNTVFAADTTLGAGSSIIVKAAGTVQIVAVDTELGCRGYVKFVSRQ